MNKLSAPCLSLLVLAGAASARSETEWAAVQQLLRDCTGVVSNPLPAAECRMLTAAPLLGNGEVGVVIGGDAQRLSLFVARADARQYAIGGVDLAVDGPNHAAAPGRHVQDPERAEVRSEITLAGRRLDVTSWVVPDQPLLVCQVSNPSDTPLTLKVHTWTRPPVSMRFPFRLSDGTMGSAGLDLNLMDRDGTVVYGAPQTEGADLWVYAEVDNIPCLRNVGTGRYMATTPKGTVVTLEKPDDTAALRVGWKGWHGRSQWRIGGRFLNVSRGANGTDTLAVATGGGGRYGTAMESAAHRFFPETAGHEGDVCWAWRSSGTARAVLATRVLGADVAVRDATQTLTLPAHGQATVLIAVTGDYRPANQVKSLEQCRADGEALVKGLTAEGVARLSEARIANWKDYWLKAWLDTGDPVLNRFWYSSLYLLKSTNQRGQQSPALYGVWNTSDNPACLNGEFNNYNYEAQHYGTFTANRGELATPQFDDILKALPGAQRQAANAGYPGAMWGRIVLNHYNGPVPTNFPPPKVSGKKNRSALGNDQLDAPAFLAMNFLYAYETTLDRTFLEKKAYPMVRACMDFYTDYLTLNVEKNRYELQRSAAREGTSDNNPAYPLAFIKRLAIAAADYSEVLGVDADKRDKWRDIAKRMSAYPTTVIAGKTMFRETESSPRVLLRGPGDNVSLLQLIHPGEGVGLDSDTNLLAIARNTLAYANSNTNKPSWLQTANNPALIFVQAATIGWHAKDLYYWLHRYLTEEERPNLTWQVWGIEGASATEAIHRMMFQSQEGVLRFFPVWPKDKDAQFHHLRAFGAFIVSAELKGGVVSGVNILSEKGSDCTVLNPWPGKSVQVIRGGQSAELATGERFIVKTIPGETIQLTTKANK